MNLSRVGVDLAKNIFQLHGVDREGKTVWKRRLSRDKWLNVLFETVKPGQISIKTAPHINLMIFMRGLLSHVFTRIYFSDEKNSNLLDETLLTIPAYRQETLVAKKLSGESTPIYEFNIHLQGEKETVFFDA